MTPVLPELGKTLGGPLAAAVLFAFGLAVAAVPWFLAGVVERDLVRRGRAGTAIGAGLAVRGVGVVLAVFAAMLTADALAFQDWEGVAWGDALAAVLFLALGTVVVRQVAVALERSLAQAGRPHGSLMVGKVVRSVGIVLVVLAVAQAFGFDLTAILATAGVVGVAIGFAAQTSLANVIAGFFLLIDRPFEVGDVVEITGQLGTVQGITLLSTHVRTFENLVVRWPNEVVLKERIVNYSRFPARRLELRVRLPYGAPIEAVQQALREALLDEPALLLDPPPDLRLRDLDDNGVTMLVRAWAPVEGWLGARDAFVLVVHRTLTALDVPPRVPTYFATFPGPTDA